MKSIKTLLLVLTAWLGLSVGASAQQYAYTARDAELHAGPAFEYPTVAIILNNIAITVEGCVDGYQWCDVTAGPYRGWMYAGDVVYPYQGGYYPISSYGPMIGLTVIGFSTALYWDRHYRTSPWYQHRTYWVERPAPRFRDSRETREYRGAPPPPRYEHVKPTYGREPEHRAIGGGGGGSNIRSIESNVGGRAPAAAPVVRSAPPVVAAPAPGAASPGVPSTRRSSVSPGGLDSGSSSGSSGGGQSSGGGNRSHDGGGNSGGGGGFGGREGGRYR
jgi:uncharacterized protein YraI